MRAGHLGQFGRGPQGVEVDLLGDAGRQGACLGGVERQPQLEEHVLEAHEAHAHRPPQRVGVLGLGGRVVVDVDHPVEERHGDADHLGEALEVEGAVDDQRPEVDRTQVADRCLVLVGDLDDLGAQVRQVHDPAGFAGLVALGVGGVLEGHPAVAGLGEGAHHAAVELAGRDLALVEALLLGLDVGGLELVAVEVGEVWDLLGVEQRPDPVLFDPLHEQVGDPVGEVEVVGAALVVAGVLAQVEEVLDVGVPGLEVDAGCALAAATLVHRGHGAVEGLEPRHDAVRQAVGALDERALGPDPVPCHADAAGELREAGDVGVALVDALEAVLGRVEQVARRHLRVGGARVEQRGARGQVLERRDELVEPDGLVGAGGKAAGDPQEEVLGGLEDVAGFGVAQQVAVIDGAQAEELEQVVAVVDDRVVELAGVGGDELDGGVADDAELVADQDRLGEGVDVLVAHLLVDDRGEEAAGQAGVVGLLDHERRRGTD